MAGEPRRRARRAYAAAADEAARRGTPTVLVVNDLDAGVGEIQGRQGDGEQPDRAGEPDEPVRHPHRGRARDPKRADRRAWDSREERVVANDGDERADTRKRWEREVSPVPIVVTGNDFSRLYAPPTRSGRMDLWHWEPSRSEIAGDAARHAGARRGRGRRDVWVRRRTDARVGGAVPGPAAGLFRRRARGARRRRARLGQRRGLETRKAKRFGFDHGSPPKQDVSLPAMLRAATRVAREQQNVLDANLAREYVNAWTDTKRGRDPRAQARRRRARARQRRGTSSTRTPRSAPSGSARCAQTRKRGRATRRATRRAPPPRLCRRRPPRRRGWA